ncbi:radical SAM protein [Desulfobacula sp.]|uniref:radical SAM protein n=1 Tax=Desulfobacula sp. TaxID=2593537 RepID=UPI00261FE15E|nr:radical SAM protein [Desulfobacula sp.]
MKFKKKFDELSPFKIIHHNIDQKFPIHVEIDPTSTCQQDCIRCSYKQNIDGKRDYIIHKQNARLPYDKFLDLIDELKTIGIKAITLSGGGEPLIYPKIESIIDHILTSGIQIGVITNLSTKIDTGLLSKAIWVRVSLDAASHKIYETVHRPKNQNAFSLVCENISSIIKKNDSIDLGVNFLIQPENYSEIYDAARLVKKLGAKYIRFAPVIATDHIDYEQLFGECDSLLQKSLSLIDDQFHVFITKERFNSLKKNKKNYSYCYKQKIHPLIGADGNIYPCCLLKYYDRHILGSILNDTFVNVWQGEKRKDWLSKLDVDLCPPCWFDETNLFIEYLLTNNPSHVNFV